MEGYLLLGRLVYSFWTSLSINYLLNNYEIAVKAAWRIQNRNTELSFGAVLARVWQVPETNTFANG